MMQSGGIGSFRGGVENETPNSIGGRMGSGRFYTSKYSQIAKAAEIGQTLPQ